MSSNSTATGTVTNADGTPAAGVAVTVAARRLRSEAPLGETTTGSDGTYRIEYPPPGTPGDVIVRVTGDSGTSTEAVREGSEPAVTADLVLPGAKKSEYQALLDDVTPLLDGTGLADLTEDDGRRDFSFLSRATGRDALQIGFLAVSTRHAAATSLPAEPFYGLLRQGLPADLSTLAQLPTATLRASLTSAAAAGTIAATDADAFTTTLRALEIAAAVADPPGGGPSPLMSVFAAAVPDEKIRARIYTAYLDRSGVEARFWAGLRVDKETAPYAERLRLALRLGAVTGNNGAMVKDLLSRFDTNELTDASQLVTLHDQWPALVASAGNVPAAIVEASLASPSSSENGGGPEAKYADAVRSLVEQTYPTAAVAHRLSADPVHADSPAAKFLSARPDFDLLATPVDTRTVPDGRVRPELAEIQRVLKIAPRFDAMQALRDNGFTSSHAVAMTDPDAFAARLGQSVDAAEARTIHARATRVHAGAVNLVADLRTAGQFDVPWLAKTEALTAQIPDWEELFDSPDYCACPDCRSIHGEAAYLVDLLQYLVRLANSGAGAAAAPGVPDQGPVGNALYARRGDLVDIELSCDNTNLAVPYIDLVGELLESAVAPDTAVPPADRQSTGDQGQLRLQPQHVDAAAYERLRTAVYPWDLPFDLWRAQTNAYLKQLGVPRRVLLGALGSYPADPDESVDEQLGLTGVAATIIAGEQLTPARTLAEFYGQPATTAPDTLATGLSRVRTLLDTAAMRYADLVAVLDTRFVNPGREIQVVTADTDNPCNTETLYLQPLDAAALDRLHRFVRLQRALGWSAPRLDRVIAAAGNQGRLDRTTLRTVAAVANLATRLDSAVDDVLCFYSPLETHRYLTEDELPRYDRLFLDPTVVQTPPGTPNPFALNADGTEVAVPGGLLDPVVAAALLGILQVTDEDLVALVSGPRAITAGHVVNLANLSALVRTVDLAEALSLPVPDLLRLIELYGDGGPFPPIGAMAAIGDEPELASGAPMLPALGEPLPAFAPGAEAELAGGQPLVPPRGEDAASALPPTDALVVTTDRFLDAVDAITDAGFTVSEVDAVLADVADGNDGVLPDDTALAVTLTALRSAVQAVYRQTAQTTDEKGDLTRKELAQLGWDAGLVQDAVSALLGTTTYTADLPVLGAGIELPALPQLRYSPEEGQLSFTGPMDEAQHLALTGLANADGAFLAAVGSLFAAPRTFVATRMKVLRIPVTTAPLAALAPDFPMPKSLVDKVYFDSTKKALCLRGYLSPDDRAALLAASSDNAFGGAVANLMTAQDSFPIAPDNGFLTAADATAMFADATKTGPADRLHLVLTRIAPYLRRTLSETTVKQQVGQLAGLDAAGADVLLGTWLRTPTSAVALQDFLTPDFVGSDPAVAVTRTGFDQQFTSLALVLRVALVLTRLHATADEIPFVFGYAPGTGWLDFNRLPSAPVTGASPLFEPFVRLLNLYRLRNTVPGGSKTLLPVFAAATAPGATTGQVVGELSTRTGWNADDVTRLAELLDLVVASRFADENALLAMLTAVRTLRKLGVSAERATGWLATDLTQDAAQAAWQATKSRYPNDDWVAVATPLQDSLRELQRAALVSYLIANPLLAADGSPQWTDSDGLHDYFLIDVEMGAAQQTTRIAQAIYTVQLFVQRCLLNLEPAVSGLSGVIDEWAWMKQYRLWEANQKVFLYPENYLDPALRAGKSEFFTDFESELMQQDVTADVADTAFRNYLEKLDDISGLIPCGIYTDDTNTLFAFARTESDPPSYYYRTRVDDQYWTTWQRIDLDIDGDVLLPISWQSRLYLFWVTFSQTSTPGPVTVPSPGLTISPAPVYSTIRLNWSQYFNGQWQPKKVAKETLTTDIPAFRPKPNETATYTGDETDPFYFEPNIEANGDMTIRCFSSYSMDILIKDIFGRTTFQSGKVWGWFTISPRTGTLSTKQLQWYQDNDPDNPPPSWVKTIACPDSTSLSNNEFRSKLYNDYHPDLELPTPNAPAENPNFLDALGLLPNEYRLLYPHQYVNHGDLENYHLFFGDTNRSYLLKPSLVTFGNADSQLTAPGFHPVKSVEAAFGGTTADTGPQTAELVRVADTDSSLGTAAPQLVQYGTYRFTTAHHPFVDDFVLRLNQNGTSSVLSRDTQLATSNDFTARYNPNPLFNQSSDPNEKCVVSTPLPVEAVDFDPGAAYTDYNWELFFHLPLLIAEKLAANQQFADAQRWFHYIFDPTSRDTSDTAPQRYWQTKPFFLTTSDDYAKQRIESILDALGRGDAGADTALEKWLESPFQPDVVARLRTTAYQKAVVMKYLDNLIAWGDQLYRQDTWEAISSATQLYVLAAELLGRRPDEVTGMDGTATGSFRQLQLGSAAAASAVVLAEHLLPAEGTARPAIAPGLSLSALTYFRIPRNDKLVGYWDTVADRLFKIRHGQNIDGVQQDIPLFGPPIDPNLLIRAALAGVDLSTVLDDVSAPLPHYRFTTVLAKAKELTAEVKSFGSALLSALEKRDAESLGRLRTTHELSVLKAARAVKVRQVDEATEAVDALTRSQAIASDKQTYYGGKSRTNEREDTYASLTGDAMDEQDTARTFNMIASAVSSIPDVKIGTATTIGATWGSSNIIAGIRGIAEAIATGASIKHSRAALASTQGGWDHRYEDWQFQSAQAGLEVKQYDSQLAGARIRLEVAQKELDNHDLQIANAGEDNDFLHGKFTSQELYDWMSGQLSTTYFQAYQLAYDVAKRAERAYRYELGVDDTDFIRFGYWDSLHKGLLSGERLAADLNRMDAAYLEANAREFELSKRISLAQLDPKALLSLKETGRCYLSLPEAVFDLDTPGHYLRRIRNLSVTVPCVAGPYTGVNLTATLLKSSVRVDPRVPDDGAYARGPSDTRFRDATGPIESIVTSTGQDDAGLFETNLRDERFLPFEGSGVISEWQLSLPNELRQFDYESITDVVLHLRYTARDGGQSLAASAVGEVRDTLNKWVHAGGGKALYRAFSVRREFSDQWTGFVTGSRPSITLSLSKTRFPYLFRDERITLGQPELVFVLSTDLVADGSKRFVDCYEANPTNPVATLTSPRGIRTQTTLLADAALDGQPHNGFAGAGGQLAETAEDWVLTVPVDGLEGTNLLVGGKLNPDAVVDLLLIWQYTVEKVSP